MKKGILIYLFLLFIYGSTKSQQISISNQYLSNPYVLNPSFAGSSSLLHGSIGYRKQWPGIQGSPENKYVLLHGSIYKNMGLGAALNMEEFSILRKFSFRLSYAYQLKLNDEHTLGFGMDGVYREKSLNNAIIDVNDYLDPVIINTDLNKARAANFNIGMRYNFKSIVAGVSVQNILSSTYSINKENSVVFYQDAFHYNAFASYSIKLSNEMFAFDPMLVFRGVSNIYLLDVGVKTSYKDKAFVSVFYRNNNSLPLSLGVNISQYFQVGYSYEQGFGNSLYNYSNHVHEFFLSFNLSNKSKKIEEENAKMALYNDELKRKSDSLAQALYNADLILQKAKLEQEEKEKEYAAKISSLEGENNQLKSTATTNNAPKEGGNTSESTPAAASKNTDFSSETALDNLLKGHYIVIKSYLDKNLAIKMMEEVQTKGYQPMLVFNKNRGYYYIYLQKMDNLPAALKELEAVKGAGFKDAWLYLHQ